MLKCTAVQLTQRGKYFIVPKTGGAGGAGALKLTLKRNFYLLFFCILLD